MKRYPFLMGGALIGLILGFTNALAPLHEFYHLAVAGSHGVNAQITSWNTTELAQFNAPAVFAGWSSNLWFGVLAAVIFAIIGRRTRASWFTGAGGLAYAADGWGRAYDSWDFNGAIKAFIATKVSDPSQQFYAWEQIHHEIVIRWTIVGLIVLLFGLTIVLWNVRDKKKAA